MQEGQGCLRKPYKKLTREAKGKGERERYARFNAEFQRRATRDKNALLSETMQRNRGKQQNGKTGDLFKKIGDTKRTFHAKMGTIKDRNGKDLTEAEEVARIHRRPTQKIS